jgi:integrase
MAKVYQMCKEVRPDGRVRWVRSCQSISGARWFVDYSDPNGKQVRIATAARTRKDALRILHARLGEVARAEAAGIHPLALSMTIGKFLDQVYYPHARATLRSSTVRSYVAYGPLLKAHFGDKPLSAVSRGDVLQLQAALLRREKTLAPATINRVVSFVRTVLYEAVQREHIDRNPAARLKMLPEENTLFRVLSTAEERRLLEQAPPWLKRTIRIALLTGLRQGEILRLRKQDVDQERRMIHVSPEAKNHHSRMVPFPESLEPVLDELLGDEVPPERFLFAKPDGKPFDRCKIVNGFTKLVRRTGLHDCSFHDLRRTYASRLVNRGVSLPVIAKLLGHGATYVTERYAHVAEGALAAAVARLDPSRFPADGSSWHADVR